MKPWMSTILAALFASNAHAVHFEGTWTGKLETSGGVRELTLDVNERLVDRYQTHAIVRFSGPVVQSVGFAYSFATDLSVYIPKDAVQAPPLEDAEVCEFAIRLVPTDDGISGKLYYNVWQPLPSNPDELTCDRGPLLGTVTLQRTGESASVLHGGTLRMPAFDDPSVTHEHDITLGVFPDGQAAYHATREVPYGSFVIVWNFGRPVSREGNTVRFRGPSLWNADGSDPDHWRSWLVGTWGESGIEGDVYSLVDGQPTDHVGPFSIALRSRSRD